MTLERQKQAKHSGGHFVQICTMVGTVLSYSDFRDVIFFDVPPSEDRKNSNDSLVIDNLSVLV